jgi:hypothetical protein
VSINLTLFAENIANVNALKLVYIVLYADADIRISDVIVSNRCSSIIIRAISILKRSQINVIIYGLITVIRYKIRIFIRIKVEVDIYDVSTIQVELINITIKRIIYKVRYIVSLGTIRGII